MCCGPSKDKEKKWNIFNSAEIVSLKATKLSFKCRDFTSQCVNSDMKSDIQKSWKTRSSSKCLQVITSAYRNHNMFSAMAISKTMELFIQKGTNLLLR